MAWWVWPSRLRHQVVALEIVGSNPITHPTRPSSYDIDEARRFAASLGVP